MQKQILNSIEKFNKSMIGSVKTLGEINMRTLERLTERQIEVASDYLDGGMKQIKLASESKDPQGVLSAQSKLATEYGEKFVEHAKKTAEIFAETKAELAGWIEDGMKAIGTTPLVKAASTTKKAA